MLNSNINTDTPIINLSVNFDQVTLSISEQNVSALIRSSDFDHNVKSQIEYIQQIFEKTFKAVTEEYAKLLAEIYVEVSVEEVAPTSRCMTYYIEGEEDYNDED
ncbi:MAG: hypothetical protein K2G70_03095 [Turicibacter sp.]|nr:hypothetical protein [Turicibacter sp.]